MDAIIFLIILIFLLMIFFRIVNIKKPICLFGVLQKGKKALMIRLISIAIMGFIVYGLFFSLFWGFVLYAIDYLIGISHALIAIKNPKVSYDFYLEGIFKSYKKLVPYANMAMIIFWALATIYLYKLFILS